MPGEDSAYGCKGRRKGRSIHPDRDQVGAQGDDSATCNVGRYRYPVSDSGVAGLGHDMPLVNSSIERRRFGKTVWRRGLSYGVRGYVLWGPMGPSGCTARALVVRDDAIGRVIV